SGLRTGGCPCAAAVHGDPTIRDPTGRQHGVGYPGRGGLRRDRASGAVIPMTSRVILAPNPGPMTLEGTNSYALGAPGSAGHVIVDPGPSDAGHLTAIAALQPELILITHHHSDHTEASAELHRRTGAPVRAIDPAYCHGGDPLVD